MFHKILFSLILLLCVPFAGCDGSGNKVLAVGDQAPDFTGVSLKGGSVRLSEQTGAPVILRFWSTECDYCRADTPIFNHYFEQYKEKGLRVIYINTGEESLEVVKKFVTDLEIPFPVIMEGGDKISAKYNVKIVPQTIFIDPNGKIMTAILGGVSKGELAKILGSYL